MPNKTQRAAQRHRYNMKYKARKAEKNRIEEVFTKMAGILDLLEGDEEE